MLNIFESQTEICVTVIILTYNQQKYISNTLDSVLSQKTNFKTEILVGDDASTDGTSQVLKNYQNKASVFIYTREHNIGGTANLVDLLKRARGKYIASCEGDDYWTDSEKLQKQVDFLEKNPEYIACTHDILLIDSNGHSCKKQKLNWVKNVPIFRFNDFKGIFLPGHPVSMVYRNIFTHNPHFLNFIMNVHPQIADRTIAMLLAANGSIARLPENMACYRQMAHEGLTKNEFACNPYGKLTNFIITNKLEKYAVKQLGVKANFNSLRIDLLLHALGKAILGLSYKEFDCFKKMIKEWISFANERKKYERM